MNVCICAHSSESLAETKESLTQIAHRNIISKCVLSWWCRTILIMEKSKYEINSKFHLKYEYNPYISIFNYLPPGYNVRLDANLK